MSVREKAREIAVQALYQYALRGPGDLDEIAGFAWIEGDAYVRITELAADWLRGAVADSGEIDALIDGHLVDWAPERVGLIERAILRLAVHEMRSEPDLPVEIIINEAVKLCKRYCDAESFKFINGVLDAVAGALGRKTRG